jgi:hypothetical protein
MYRCCLALFLLCVIELIPLYRRAAAQTGLSSVNGIVADSSGATVPGASIVLTNQATGVQRTLTTSNLGYYDIPALPRENTSSQSRSPDSIGQLAALLSRCCRT